MILVSFFLRATRTTNSLLAGDLVWHLGFDLWHSYEDFLISFYGPLRDHQQLTITLGQ